MAWLRFTLDCRDADVDPLTEFLERLGAVSVSVAARDGEPLFGDAPGVPAYWRQSRLTALFPADADRDILVACLRNRLGAAPAAALAVNLLADDDWSRSGRDAREPLLFGADLCVCPGWVEPPAGRRVLRLDPGIAFGTGSHPTTGLCLDWLAARELEDRLVIDYGCGSGILGLAAALRGAREARLVDIDAQALTASRANAERNDLTARVRLCTPETLPPEPADVLVANILLDPLVKLAPRFAQLTAPGAAIALSGLLANQIGACLAAYEPWFRMGPMTFRDEWALVVGMRSR
jgi:ribosomal protein L11 methyltransferase